MARSTGGWQENAQDARSQHLPAHRHTLPRATVHPRKESLARIIHDGSSRNR